MANKPRKVKWGGVGVVTEKEGEGGRRGREVPRARGPFSTKTGQVLDKPGRVGHPRKGSHIY